MNDETRAALQAEIRQGFFQAIHEFQGIPTNGEALPAAAEEEYHFADEESSSNGIEIPEEMSGWFPSTATKGRLSYESFKRIMDENPEPNGNLLRPPMLDLYIREIISRDAIGRDEALTALQVDTGRGLRPIISLAAMLDRSEIAFKKCKQAIFIGINTMAKIALQRKTAILRALKMAEADVKFWCDKHSDSREWLFGDRLKEALESKQHRQFQRSITRIVTDRARSYNQGQSISATSAPVSSSSYNPSQHSQARRGGYRPRGRGRGPNIQHQHQGHSHSTSTTSNI